MRSDSTLTNGSSHEQETKEKNPDEVIGVLPVPVEPRAKVPELVPVMVRNPCSDSLFVPQYHLQ